MGCPWSGFARPAEDVPRSGDGEEEQDAGYGLKFAPAAPLPTQHQQRDRCRGEEHRGNQALGQRREREGSPHAVKADRIPALKPGDETPKSIEQQETQQCLGDGKARKEEWSDGSEHSQCGVQARSPAPTARPPKPCQPREAENGQGIGQVGCENILPEYLVTRRVEPIGQRRFLEVADPIELHGDPVTALVHVLRYLRVRGVDVVEQRWREK